MLMLLTASKKKKGRNNMKCAMCGREIKGMDYIRVNVPNKEDIYVHSAPCEWYTAEENRDNSA